MAFTALAAFQGGRFEVGRGGAFSRTSDIEVGRVVEVEVNGGGVAGGILISYTFLKVLSRTGPGRTWDLMDFLFIFSL